MRSELKITIFILAGGFNFASTVRSQLSPRMNFGKICGLNVLFFGFPRSCLQQQDAAPTSTERPV